MEDNRSSRYGSFKLVSDASSHGLPKRQRGRPSRALAEHEQLIMQSKAEITELKAQLVLAESRARAAEMGTQMEIDEALVILADIAREVTDRKLQHSALRTVLQVHGVLSDKALPEDRRLAARQVEELLEGIKKKLDKGGKVRVAERVVDLQIGTDNENALSLPLPPTKPAN